MCDLKGIVLSKQKEKKGRHNENRLKEIEIMSEKDTNGTRLREIISVIHKHQIARGVTPEKLRLILEDLGPTYIKLGQIMSMRSDIFPKKICDEFMRLRSEVTPMPFSEVQEVIEHAYGTALNEVFADFLKKHRLVPLPLLRCIRQNSKPVRQ